jgi:uncharacterized protein (TIGR01244 family)
MARMRNILIVITCSIVCGPVVSAQQKMERPGITNYTKVDAVVACGGATDTAALEALKNDGFKAVINLRQASEEGANIEQNAARAKTLGLNYIHIPFNGQAPESKTVDDFLAAVSNKANQPVFIHCGSANRVGAVWLVKRVLQDGWAVDKATEEAKLIGLRSAPLEQFALKYIEEHKK